MKIRKGFTQHLNSLVYVIQVHSMWYGMLGLAMQ